MVAPAAAAARTGRAAGTGAYWPTTIGRGVASRKRAASRTVGHGPRSASEAAGARDALALPQSDAGCLVRVRVRVGVGVGLGLAEASWASHYNIWSGLGLGLGLGLGVCRRTDPETTSIRSEPEAAAPPTKDAPRGSVAPSSAPIPSLLPPILMPCRLERILPHTRELLPRTWLGLGLGLGLSLGFGVWG